MTFRCSVCGQAHRELLENEYEVQRPDALTEIPIWKRPFVRVSQSDDLCSIDKRYFVRGLLQIPIKGTSDAYSFGVWAEVSQMNFSKYSDMYNDESQAQEPPFIGALATELPQYGDTSGLPVWIKMVSALDRPRFTVSEPSSLLGQHQKEGLELDQLMTILASTVHPELRAQHSARR